MPKTADDARDEFIERYGLITEADGLPRIAGRLLALLLLEGGPYSFSTLVTRLNVSRASVSTSSRLLEQAGAIERLTLPGKRQDHFQIAPRPYVRMMEGVMARHTKTRQAIENVLADYPDLSDDARERLEETSAFYQASHDAAREIIARLGTGKADAF
jgi:DNA-binding transcriptional regulator GbsR (MarR family)